MIPALLCAAALAAVPAQEPATKASAPATAPDHDLAAVEARGVDILLGLQEDYDLSEPKGKQRGDSDSSADRRKPGPEWPYEGVYRESGKAGRVIPPGYRIGGTSICALAMLESRRFTDDQVVQDSVAKALDFVLEHLKVKAMESGFRGGYDVRGWGHTYALDFLLRLRSLKAVPKKKAQEVDRTVTWLVRVLEETAITGETGGWNYARGGDNPSASPFMTAPTLMALWEAAHQGEKVDAKLMEKALDALEATRFENGSIPYTVGDQSDRFMNLKPGAMGRMAVTEVALSLAGRSGPAHLEDAVQTFFEHWEQLEVRRRQTGTHIRPYGVAPYYVFFAYRYVALAIAQLPDEARAKYRALFLEHLFRVQEESGGWNDRVFDRSENYGTAMSLLALRQPDLPALQGPKGK